MCRRVVWFWFLLALPAAASDDSRMEGPIVGLVYDEGARAIRPVLGLPGAATLGEALPLGFPVDRAALSPRRDYGLAATGSQVVELRIAAGAIESRPVASDAAGAWALSPGGGAAALFAPGSGAVRVIRPGAGPVDLPVGGLPGELTALAIADDAETVLASFREGPAARVYLLRSAAAPRPVHDGGYVSAIAFLPGSGDALIVDRSASRVALLRDAAGAPHAVPFADEGFGLSAPTGVAVSEDGRKAVVSNASGAPATVLDLEAGTAAAVGCPCEPEGVELLGRSLFRLTGAPGRTLWLVDAGSSEPRAVFVPRPPAAKTAGSPGRGPGSEPAPGARR